ncbi:hypothetical protein [Pimelobacter simplex]|uniref:hypothetical protein n=1 Tax=Nocardioides simplex TaxID=2045 RepID=UPI003AADD423
MLIHAAHRPQGDTTAEAVRWTIETDDYEAGMAQVKAAVPQGHVLLGVRVER